jgi:hypothetical protein
MKVADADNVNTMIIVTYLTTREAFHKFQVDPIRDSNHTITQMGPYLFPNKSFDRGATATMADALSAIWR